MHLVVSRGVGFLLPMLLASDLDPILFGRFVTLASIVMLAQMLADFGLSTALAQRVASAGDDVDTQRRLLRVAVTTLWLGGGTVVTATVAVASLWNALSFAGTTLVFAGLWAMLGASAGLLEGFVQGRAGFDRLAWGTLIGSVTVVCAWLAAPSALTIDWAIALSATPPVASLLWHGGRLRHDLVAGDWSTRVARDLLEYSLYIGASGVGYFLYTRADVLLLASQRLDSSIAAYELATRVVSVAVLPAIALARVVGVGHARDYGGGLGRAVPAWRIRTMVGALGVVAGTASYVAMRAFVRWVLPEYDTEEFALAATTLLPMIPIKFWGVYLTHAYLVPTGEAPRVARATVVAGIANVVLSWLALQRFGFPGVIWTTVVVHASAIIWLDATSTRLHSAR